MSVRVTRRQDRQAGDTLVAMAHVHTTMGLVIDPQTAAQMYARKGSKPRDMRLTEDIIDVLPEPLRRTIHVLLRDRAVEAYLVQGEDLTIEVRNKRPRRPRGTS